MEKANDLSIAQVVKAVREITFDMYSQPAFFLSSNKEHFTYSIDSKRLRVYDNGSNANLSSIYVGNTELNGFDADTLIYQYGVSYGTQNFPEVVGIADDPEATVKVTRTPGIPGSAVILVTSKSGLSTKTYRINFAVSSNADLSALTVDGDAVVGHDYANSNTIQYVFPYGTSLNSPDTYSIVPTVAENGSTFVITTPESFPGTYAISVTAPNKTTTKNYTLEFVVEEDTDLLQIAIDGTNISGFSSETLNYSVEQPFGTATDYEPTIAVTKKYAGASVQVVWDEPSRTHTITVTSQDSVTTKVYTISSPIYAGDDDVSYTDVLLDGSSYPHYIDKDLDTITVYAQGPTVPVITLAVGQNATQIDTLVASNFGESSVIRIVAQNSTTRDVTINVLEYSDSHLTDIYYDGQAIPNFSPDVLEYDLELPFGTSVSPIFSVDRAEAESTVLLESPATIAGQYKITASSDTGGTLIYLVNVTIAALVKDPTPENAVTDLYFEEYPTYKDLIDAISAESEYGVEYSPTVIGSEPSISLLSKNTTSLTENSPVLREYFFSDKYITEMVRKYFLNYPRQFGVLMITEEDIQREINFLNPNFIDHMVLWTSFYLVEDRRVYELAGDSLGFDSGTSGMSLGAYNSGNRNISVSIGDVFNIEDLSDRDLPNAEKMAGVGSDNVLGDLFGFWYKLQLHIRKRFEDFYRDYKLRSSQVIESELELDSTRDMNLNAYFDSFPYTLSPLARGVVFGQRQITSGSATYNSGYSTL